jgi:hypothetical protein
MGTTNSYSRGAEHRDPPQAPLDARNRGGATATVSCVLTGLLMTMAGCSHSTRSHVAGLEGDASPRTENVMQNAAGGDTGKQSTTNVVALAQASVSSRFLEFLAGAKTEGDFSRARFRQVLELAPQPPPVEPGAEDQHVFATAGSEWTTTVAFLENGRAQRVEYRISHPSLHDGTSTADLTSACVLTPEQYRDKLLSAGFVEGPTLPPSPPYGEGDVLVHTFDRPFLHVLAVSQPRKPNEKHRCVIGIEALLSSTN